MTLKHKKSKRNRITRKKQRGGVKRELFPKTNYKIKAVTRWNDKEKDRQIYTYPEYLYPSESKEEDEEDIVKLQKFKHDDVKFNSEQLKQLKPYTTYIFVIEYDNKENAVMYLGYQSRSHNELSGDKGKNWILAAGELMWYPCENKFKISNQSGHYEPDSGDVKDVTIDFFAESIDIDFYKPFPNVSESESESSQSPLDMSFKKPDEIYKSKKRTLDHVESQQICSNSKKPRRIEGGRKLKKNRILKYKKSKKKKQLRKTLSKRVHKNMKQTKKYKKMR